MSSLRGTHQLNSRQNDPGLAVVRLINWRLVSVPVSNHSNAVSYCDDESANSVAEPASQTPCAWSGCLEFGEFKAPRSRQALRDYQWFCLEHIREFNRAWNYYYDMSNDQMEAAIRSDTTWNRPTWPFVGDGHINNSARPNPYHFDSIRDPFGLFSEIPSSDRTSHADSSGRIGQALNILGLQMPISFDEVRARYKSLVKRFHPDANGGDKEAEEKFKAINTAYEILRSELVT